jgi:quercetin dioxygenase-like cupin family protein
MNVFIERTLRTAVSVFCPRWIRAGAALVALVAFSPLSVQGDTSSRPSDTTVKELMTRALEGQAGKEILMETVEYAPGGKSPPHRHNAQVFVYILDGQVRMQVKGAAPVTLGPGDTFYEGPNDVHEVSENASTTRSARFLVVMVKGKGITGKARGS